MTPKEKAQTLRAIAACHHVAAEREILEQFAKEAEEPIEIGVSCEGGIVQEVRASVPFTYFVADLDVFEYCAGDEHGMCDSEEETSDREEHAATRKAIADFNAMPVLEVMTEPA